MNLNEKVFTTILNRNVKLSEAPSYGQPILMYDAASIIKQANYKYHTHIDIKLLFSCFYNLLDVM